MKLKAKTWVVYELTDIEKAAVKAGFKPQLAWDEIQGGERANGSIVALDWMESETPFGKWLFKNLKSGSYIHIYW